MAYRKKTVAEPQAILTKRHNDNIADVSNETLFAVAGLIVTCLSKGNPCYVTPGKFGGVQFKTYVEGDPLAEFITLNDQTDELVEEILDALYDTQTVSWYRNRFGSRRSELASEPRSGVKPGAK